MIKGVFFVFLHFTTIISLVSCLSMPHDEMLHWYIAGEMPPLPNQKEAIGVAGPVTGIHNGKLLLAGGANFPNRLPWEGGSKAYYKEGFVFQRNTDDSLIVLANFCLPEKTAYGACISTSRGIVLAGGENESGISDKVYLLQWQHATETVKIEELPRLPLPLTNAGITAKNHTVYVLGGESNDDVSSGFYALNLDSDSASWESLPALPQPVSHAVVTMSEAPENALYLFGGRKKNKDGISDLYAEVRRFDFRRHKWVSSVALPYPISAGTGISLRDRILLLGGDRGETFHRTEVIQAAIQSAATKEEKHTMMQFKINLQSSHPGFSRQVIAYYPTEQRWVIADSIPFEAPVTTTAIRWDNLIIIPSGEIRAGIRTPHILSARLDDKRFNP